MAKVLLKGNEAVIRGAILAGCRTYFGYPITPASEIAETAAKYMPLAGGTFIQAESEVAAINMVYGAAGAGVRVMTASSGPGISLKQEGVSYMAGAELPGVIISVVRAGPGLGNIAPEQGDYHQVVWGGGHGNYKTIVLAPNSVQEMSDLTMLAFELADKYRNPVYILTDGAIGQMKEPVEFPDPVSSLPVKEWAVGVGKEFNENLISSIFLDGDELEAHNFGLQKKYEQMQETEVRFEEYQVDDAELVVVGFGIVSRVLRSAIEVLRKEGLKVGLLRPITLWPFPEKRIQELAEESRVRCFLTAEMSDGQMVKDVRLSVLGKKPVEL
ncbi:MAG: 3-methyl-2-oxobutanoate dehydrogenase subunit VorB, partial [Candidatus Eisenbacteria sp.]|nr:3-methyl-2-oxobutanoate dehydrogenase subunit VorB [Candidatus Eisenbacteria bacterium]